MAKVKVTISELPPSGLKQPLEVKNVETITIPERIAVFTDKKTQVKTVAFPFTFPDGAPGILSLTRLVKMDWMPSTDIKTIKIEYN